MSMIDGKFFTRLAEERKRMKLSQDAIAEICGVSRKQWGNYEAGRNVPGADVLFLFVDKGADILYLMTGSRIDAEKNTSQTDSTYSRDGLDELVDVFAHTNDEGRQALLSLARFIKNK